MEPLSNVLLTCIVAPELLVKHAGYRLPMHNKVRIGIKSLYRMRTVRREAGFVSTFSMASIGINEPAFLLLHRRRLCYTANLV